MTRGVGIAKRGFGKALSRTGYSAGGEVMDDMSEGHESMESLKEEAKETKLEKKGYKETKGGKMVKDFAKKSFYKFILSLIPSGQYSIKSFLCFFKKIYNLLRLILKITVHYNYPLSTSMVQASCYCIMLSEIST